MEKISNCFLPCQAGMRFNCSMHGKKSSRSCASAALEKLLPKKKSVFATSMAGVLLQFMVTNISRSPAETEALGEGWGREAGRGLVIALCGDLGAGKTQLVKGLARGLGITARVQSPTFALVNSYTGGRLKLFHLDLYRLETREQILAAGLAEYLEPDGVTVIEWAERWFGEILSPISS